MSAPINDGGPELFAPTTPGTRVLFRETDALLLKWGYDPANLNEPA